MNKKISCARVVDTTISRVCTTTTHQTLNIQENPEHAPMGQIPCSSRVILDAELTDSCKPGDRVQIIGIYRALAASGKGSSATSGVFRTAILATNVRVLTKGVEGATMTEEDVKHVKKVAKKKDIFNRLTRSVAPSIYGHEFIKKAVVLQLLGGVEKNLENGTHLRGDINILMVGDPSTAKSQILRYVLELAPLAINTTGRGSSGVGLTAAVTTDPETRERRLEAGAMVLADRGIVCIDEFDKMSEIDRVAIHEVMEQQTVTIAKAGIHASLNARCSVIAAANPVYGQYDKSLTPQKNIDLPDSLLSRFDLLFIVLDELDDQHNAAIADHVLRLHRYQKPGMEGIPEPVGRASIAYLDDEDDYSNPHSANVTSKVYADRSRIASAERFTQAEGGRRRRKKPARLFSKDFMKKYISYAKSKITPVLTEEATTYITDAYCELRQKEGAKTLPVTARQLETIIRLSSAHARARLSNKVEQIDCEEATRVMNYALYHEAEQVQIPKRKRKPDASEAATDDAITKPARSVFMSLL